MNAVPVMWWRQNFWPIIQFLWALPIYQTGNEVSRSNLAAWREHVSWLQKGMRREDLFTMQIMYVYDVCPLPLFHRTDVGPSVIVEHN